MRMLRVAMVGVVFVTTGSMRVSGGQVFPTASQSAHQMPGLPQTPGHNPATDPDPDPTGPGRAERQAKMQNVDRQKRLVADTEKLLTLATDLKEQVDKSTKDTLSVDVIKKADEIEKLAHSVKERMKG
jgi:hypothetical protein